MTLVGRRRGCCIPGYAIGDSDMYCDFSFLSSAVGDGFSSLIYFAPNPLPFNMTVHVRASLSRKFLSALLFYLHLLGYAGFGGRRQFLVYLHQGKDPLSSAFGLACLHHGLEMLCFYEIPRHAILPSYGESQGRLELAQIYVQASQCNTGYLVNIWLLNFLCLVLESLSCGNLISGSASPS
jgi:hypothetical protein